MMAAKESARGLLTVEPEKNGLDFGAYLYRKDGVVRLGTFDHRNGWIASDMGDMMIEAQAMAEKWLKCQGKKAREEEEPS